MPAPEPGHSAPAAAAPLAVPALVEARARFQGQRVTVLGLGREGVDLTRFLARAGATVQVADRQPAERLGTGLAALDGLAVELFLGPDADPRLLDAAAVFASPGVPPSHPLLVAARAAGVRVTSLVELFFELCPAPVLGVTGSAGKTTTTTLLGEMFRAAGRDVFVGGNIGKPLLGELDRITPTSWVVMELSSFQLQPLRQSPAVAVVTNVTPNHLDRHASMEEYWEAKGQILAHQRPDDWAILNADDAWTGRFQPRARVLRFSLESRVHGAFLEGDQLFLLDEPLVAAREVKPRGRHNLANILAAAIAAHAAGVPRSSIQSAARTFAGVPHRLEVVGEWCGVRYVNDSIATAPERSMAALHAFHEPVVLIAGGRDKHLPMEDWARLIAQKARHVVLVGEMSELVERALRQVAPRFTAVCRADTMDDAVARATEIAQPGDVVLLSPGGTSFDQYRDFEDRGADFARAVARQRPRAT